MIFERTLNIFLISPIFYLLQNGYKLGHVLNCKVPTIYGGSGSLFPGNSASAFVRGLRPKGIQGLHSFWRLPFFGWLVALRFRSVSPAEQPPSTTD